MDNIVIKGHVDTVLVAPDGSRIPVNDGSNTVSYACAELAAQLFAGRGGGPAKLVMAYSTQADKESGFNFVSGSRTQTRASIIPADGGLQAAEVALEPNPVVAPSDSNKYTTGGNAVTFRAMLASNTKVYVYGYLLEDADGRVLAARSLGTGRIEKPGGYGLSVSWTITFL